MIWAIPQEASSIAKGNIDDICHRIQFFILPSPPISTPTTKIQEHMFLYAHSIYCSVNYIRVPDHSSMKSLSLLLFARSLQYWWGAMRRIGKLPLAPNKETLRILQYPSIVINRPFVTAFAFCIVSCFSPMKWKEFTGNSLSLIF